ncbi:hypothetical protein HDV02_004435 [Globomyces sp. JEL0801]|nr:hypothetical protein HDV02_004435 [Globomyces sp. JEL0801]
MKITRRKTISDVYQNRIQKIIQPDITVIDDKKILMLEKHNQTSLLIRIFRTKRYMIDKEVKQLVFNRSIIKGNLELLTVMIEFTEIDKTICIKHPTMMILKDGNLDFFKLFYNHLNFTDAICNQLIRHCSIHGHSAILEILLADPNSNPTSFDHEPLLSSASNGHLECLQLLIDDNRVNPITSMNKPLRLAAKKGHTEAARKLFMIESVRNLHNHLLDLIESRSLSVANHIEKDILLVELIISKLGLRNILAVH